jgi:protein CpxP
MTKKLSLIALAFAPMIGIAPAMAAETVSQAAPASHAAPAAMTAAPATTPAAAPVAVTTTTTKATTQTTAAPAKPGRTQIEAERRLADLHGKLKITASEQAQWDDFAATMRQNAVETDELVAQREQATGATALESMQSYAKFAQSNADNVQRLLPKFEALYNAMTPDQKKTADEIFTKARQRAMKMGHPG